MDLAKRDLDEFDVLVRDSQALGILRKILLHDEDSITKILAADKEFGLTSNFNEFGKIKKAGTIELYAYNSGKRATGWVSRSKITKSAELIDNLESAHSCSRPWKQWWPGSS